MTGTRNLIRAPLTQARQPLACPTPGAGERLGAHNGLLFSPTLMPPGMGWETHQLISISSFTSFTPTIPWCQGGTWHQFSFRLRAAPKLYGSPELGVLLLLYWRLSGGTHKKTLKNL